MSFGLLASLIGEAGIEPVTFSTSVRLRTFRLHMLFCYSVRVFITLSIDALLVDHFFV